jgi:hypothetical protein
MISRQSARAVARLWLADRVERWPIERLIPYANNARAHTEADEAKIAASITRWAGRCRCWLTSRVCSLSVIYGSERRTGWS